MITQSSTAFQRTAHDYPRTYHGRITDKRARGDRPMYQASELILYIDARARARARKTLPPGRSAQPPGLLEKPPGLLEKHLGLSGKRGRPLCIKRVDPFHTKGYTPFNPKGIPFSSKGVYPFNTRGCTLLTQGGIPLWVKSPWGFTRKSRGFFQKSRGFFQKSRGFSNRPGRALWR